MQLEGAAPGPGEELGTLAGLGPGPGELELVFLPPLATTPTTTRPWPPTGMCQVEFKLI